MKIKISTLLLTLVFVTFISCNNDENSSQIETLNGTWKLKNISGGIVGIDDEYQNGTITWVFNNQNLTLNVENNTENNSYSGLESGTYSYAIIENNGSEYIQINTTDYGKYILSDSNLTIDQNELQSGSGADGYMLQFER